MPRLALLLITIAGCGGTSDVSPNRAVTPTSTATPTPTPTRTPTPRPAVIAVAAGSAAGVPGQQVSFAVTLESPFPSIAGTQNDIAFDGRAAIAARFVDEKPDCTVNPHIKKGQTDFAFRADGSVRARVLSTENVEAIPDGSVLYTCNVNIAPSAPPGDYPLHVSGVRLETPNEEEVEDAASIDGAVVVIDTPGPDLHARGSNGRPQPANGRGDPVWSPFRTCHHTRGFSHPTSNQ